MHVDDRPDLDRVSLTDGPGPEALWPLALGGRYVEQRREWAFPKGTDASTILAAAGADWRRTSEGDHLAAGDRGEYDPLIAEVDAGTDDPGDGSARGRLVARAVRNWTDQLVDRTARNNLLYFRDQRTGTLDLTSVAPRLLFDVLAGRTRSVTQLTGPDTGAIADGVRRSKALHNKAQAVFEERGVHTLHLACGLATWVNQHGSATPAAPVLLAPVTLTPRGAAQQDFDLAVAGDLEVNPTLLNALAAEFDCHCDPEELLASAGIEGAIDTPDELRVVFEWLGDRTAAVPGFSIGDKAVLGNFSYAKLPMVRDLQSSLEALGAHELVAALAGDPDAQKAIRARRAEVDPSLPDQTAPADEFLVLDADSSQNYAINKVLAGQDLVIKGPPGTGKSQTITNLIAGLCARGQRVLFVAEKRAAIDAVVKRLDQVGLGDLVLDLHGGVSSKRQVAQSLAATLRTNASIAQPRLDADHRKLEARRQQLNAWNEALHDARSPWNVSLLEAQQSVLALARSGQTSFRLRGRALRSCSEAERERVRELLREFVALGGLRATAWSPWAGAPITTRGEVERARELVDDLAGGMLDAALDRLERANEAVGLRPVESLSEWDDRVALWTGIDGTLGRFDRAVFDEPAHEAVARLAPLGEGAGARLSAALGDGDYRNAHKRWKALQLEGVKLRKAALLEAATAVEAQQRAWSSIVEDDSTPRPPDDLDDLRVAHERLFELVGELGRLLGRAVDRDSRLDVQDLLLRLRADTATLGRLPDLHDLRTRLHAAGLRDLLEQLATADFDVDVDTAVNTFDYAFFASVVDEVRLDDPRVGGFDGAHHASCVEEFQAVDQRHIASAAQRVRRLAAERALALEDAHPDQATLIRREAAKKSRHRPVRETFAAAPEVMTGLKPCWVMSPLVVSQLLPNDGPLFDVVIFDEASQVRPAEAIPAIARGRRLVVAGDERQLPPTDFFSGPALLSDDEDPESLAADANFESILDALLFLVDWDMLRWHYRSQDERLIAFSNAHLYDRSMLTFPGVTGPDCLRHVEVPFAPGGLPADGSPSAEVTRVVELILEHAANRPEQSLGVIAMGITHADRIDGALRSALQGRSDLNDFFDESRPERFFVKNLERVQGDERDAIILTVGYGKNPDGRMLYRFGPLNSEGGERRLNVAVTRARRRMAVVSSFASADMDPERTTARGADLLRRYLAYAETHGKVLDRQAAETPELNPFEIDVRDALERAGIPLICQHGASGYRLDFAAKHPTQPGRLVLAIEADGAGYHSSQTARDRDRLRQEQLERLGWRFHRIWSQDWFKDREREVEKAIAAYGAAVLAADEATPAATPVIPPGVESPPGPTRSPRPDVHAWGQIDEFTDRELQAIVRWIESDTLLRSRDELLAEAMRELGFARRGSKIVARIGAAIDATRRPWG